MDDKSRIAEIRINPGTAFPNDITDSIVYNVEDQIGSSVVRLDTNATVIDKEEYYPFGDSSLRTFTYKRYRYVGKERDAESGLYYYGARYYAAWTCRFISVDPLAKKYANLSPYNYADNNPINDYDIDGMQNNNSQPVPNRGPYTTPTKGDSGGCMTCPNTTGSSIPLNSGMQAVATGNGQPSNESKSTSSSLRGRDYHEGKTETTYDAKIKSASNLNTTNVSRTIDYGEPSKADYANKAYELSYNGGVEAEAFGQGINTQGDIKLGAPTGKLGPSSGVGLNVTVSAPDGTVKAIGYNFPTSNGNTFDTNLGKDAISLGVVGLSNEKSLVRDSTHVIFDKSGVKTGTVEMIYSIQNKSGNIGPVSGYDSKVSGIRSFTSTTGQITKEKVADVHNSGVGFKAQITPAFSIKVEAPIR